MEQQEVIQKILANTYTEIDAARRLLLLHDFADHISYGTTTGSAADYAGMLMERYRDSVDQVTAEAVAAWGPEVIALCAGSSGSATLASLKAAIDSLPEMTLYVPVMLAPTDIASIGEWCRAQVHPQVLLTMRIDSSVIGGCAVVWNDAYWDFSIEYFMEKYKAEFTGILDEFQKSQQ